ncbi:ABC transporter ATP-binding protein [Streptomyces sp. NPDC088923]|uniref:ABC transporter ATP-binding protein n=1 Tax=Streptomyces sp. NPDC088923 TaxID=3365913 RepID=UPI0037FA5B61
MTTPVPPPAASPLALLAPVKRRLLLALALQACAAATGILPFFAIARLTARLADDTGGAADDAWPWVSLACGSGVAALALGFLAGLLAHQADNDLQLSLRRRLAAHIGRLPLGALTRRRDAIESAVRDDVHALHALVAHTLLDVTALLVAPLLAFGVLVVADWRLALLALLPPLAGALLFRRAMAGAKARMAEFGAAQARVSAAAAEYAQGIAVVRGFGRARTAHERFVTATDAFAAFFTSWVRSTLVPSTAALLVVSPALVLLLLVAAAAPLVVSDGLSTASLLAFVLLGPALAAPLGVVGTRVQQIRGGQAAAARITALLATPSLPAPARPVLPQGAHVSFRDVSFSYDGERDALSGVDLDLAPGTVTALVGPSGAGKSTLAALLARFHDVRGGAVTIGGADVREIPREALYRSVGFVLQDVRLLRASVADNIRLGRPSATDEEVERAARAAHAHDMITALPDGYATEVGTRARFSGGEAQRVSIARALLADAPVLVLDEATAYADPYTEALVQDALSTLAAGRTVLVVAHRLTTVRDADRIVVLEEGRVVESGRHAELLAAQGRYARLWHAQAAEPEPGQLAAGERDGSGGPSGAAPVIPGPGPTADSSQPKRTMHSAPSAEALSTENSSAEATPPAQSPPPPRTPGSRKVTHP